MKFSIFNKLFLLASFRWFIKTAPTTQAIYHDVTSSNEIEIVSGYESTRLYVEWPCGFISWTCKQMTIVHLEGE